MCTVLLPPGDNPISVNKYIIFIPYIYIYIYIYTYIATERLVLRRLRLSPANFYSTSVPRRFLIYSNSGKIAAFVTTVIMDLVALRSTNKSITIYVTSTKAAVSLNVKKSYIFRPANTAIIRLNKNKINSCTVPKILLTSIHTYMKQSTQIERTSDLFFIFFIFSLMMVNLVNRNMLLFVPFKNRFVFGRNIVLLFFWWCKQNVLGSKLKIFF